MKLVGATGGFIRRPFIINNLLHGIIAAIVAIGLLSALLCYSFSFDTSVQQAVSWDQMIWVFSGMIVAGILICTISAMLATNRYLRIDYDDMFK